MRSRCPANELVSFCCDLGAYAALAFVMASCLGRGLYLLWLKPLGRYSALSAPRLPEHEIFMFYCLLALYPSHPCCVSLELVVLWFSYG
jgi:hypothetical protein